MTRIYLASPLGFAASTASFMADLVGRLSFHYEVSNPWDEDEFDADFQRAAAMDSVSARYGLLHRIDMELGRRNEQRIRQADALIAILDGVDVDSGTASEIGFAYALDKRIDGLRTDFRLAGDNAGSIVNLQVEYFIEASGGSIYASTDALIAGVSAQD